MSAMRPMRLPTKFYASALGLVMGAAVLVMPASVRAAEDDDVPLDTKILRGILEGIGLRRDGEAINYQERAPLVIPPGRALPPPEKTDAALEKNPAWPVDPDVKRRKDEAKAERNKLSATDQILHDERPLRPDEMTPGPKPRVARRANPDSYQAPVNGYGNALSPAELGTKKSIFSMFGKDDDEVGKFTGEPPRASLTAPPPGYQTPSPDQPYGVGKEKPKAATSSDYFTDHPVSNN
jgi:hypothetical protein